VLFVVGNYHPVLLAYGAEVLELPGDVFADLHSGGHQHRPESRGVIDGQLRPGIPLEDGVLDSASGSRDIEALAVPVEPVGAQVRPTVSTDASDDYVSGFGEELLEFLG